MPDDLHFGPCTHAMAACFRQGLRVCEVAPELQDLAERDAGLVTLVSLVARDGPVSITQLARQFHVLRAHAGNVLQRAEQQGFACSDPGLTGYRAGAALNPVLSRFYAIIFLTFSAALKQSRPSDC